jgi:xylulokinase
MAEYLLAHDLGTSGNKSTLYKPDGKLVASATCAYPTNYSNGNWAEQNPQDWWRAVCLSTRQLLERSDVNPADIAVVALSGQMQGCTPVDGKGNALHPSMLYCDQRSTAQATQILSRIDPEHFYRIVGHRVSASYTLEKLMWIRDHEPEIYARTSRTLCAKDYINYWLTGRMVTDFSDASGTNAFDLNTSCWSDEIIELAGVERALFPEAMESSAILGAVNARAAKETGLLEGTPVAVGGGDGSCAAVGVGCIRPGMVYNCLGSTSWIGLTVRKPIVDPMMRTMNWAHCVPGYLHSCGTMQTAGATQKWLKETLCTLEEQEAERTGRNAYEIMDEAIDRVPAGAHGVLFLPYLLGERTPWWNPSARGAFIGMSMATRREDLMRAALEGVSMNLNLILNIFRAQVPIDAVTMIGGGARSGIWRQIIADVFGCPIHSLNALEEATSMGAAVIGGVAAGVFPDFDVIDRFVRVQDTTLPNAVRQALYARLMPIFEKAYRSSIEVYDDLAMLNL